MRPARPEPCSNTTTGAVVAPACWMRIPTGTILASRAPLR